MRENVNKISKKVKIIIFILLALAVISATALACRVIYLNFFADRAATAVVPDNLIGDGDSDGKPTAKNTDNNGISRLSAGQMGAGAIFVDSTASTEITAKDNENNNLNNAQANSASIELHKGSPKDNEKFTAENMLPGDREIGYFAVKVSHHADVTVYFKTEITEQTKNLADVLHIKITHVDENKVIYDGTFAQMDKDGYGVTLKTSESTETIAHYMIEVSLSTTVGNEHQGARLKADFDWYVKDTGVLDPPQTGDNSNTVFGVLLMLIALALILVLILVKRREKEREAE